MHRAYNILIVDNNPTDAEYLEKELREGGVRFQSRRVETFGQFQVELDLGHPDLVLAEYALPDFTVTQALAYLKERNINVPLVLVTSTRLEEVVLDCIQHGAQDYIFKECLLRLPSAVQNTLARSRAERDRAATEARYRVITESTRDLICLIDRNLHILYASPSYERVLSHKIIALEGIPFMSLVHPEDVGPLERSLEEALFFREGRNVELRICHANGSWQYFEATTTYLFAQNGQPEQALVVCRDTSDRKRAEKEIRKLAAFPRFNPNPVLEFASDGTLTYFNDAAMRMARNLKRPHPQMILPLNTATIVKQCLSSMKNRLDVETSEGGRCVRWSFFPIAGNHVVHCYAEDVTEGRNLEAQLRQTQKMDSIGQLAAGVAHDFNNILTVIQGHSSLMLSHGELDTFLSQSANQIAMASERAAGLTRQLLMFSRKQIMQPQLLNLNQVINNVSKILRSLLGEQNILKIVNIPDLPHIYADPGMMEQILVNLVVNARDAMGHGGTVTLSTFFIETDEHYVKEHPQGRIGKFVCLSVADTGQGMDDETLSHIFEPFFTTKEVGRGTGLGLATVYGIVNQHEGWIEVESQPERGATFTLFIPVSTKASPVVDPHVQNNAPNGHETVLVVEDEDSLRELVQEILEKKGYRVLPASDGVAALEVWNDHKDEIDLLLTDMMMPAGISGKELADRILAERQNLKVLYTSGYSIDVVNPGFISKAGHNFLQKPYHPDLLAQAVHDCLKG